MKTIEIYQTFDGEKHKNTTNAINHCLTSAQLKLEDILKMAGIDCTYRNSQKIIDLMIDDDDNTTAVFNLLQQIVKYIEDIKMEQDHPF